MAAFVFFYTLTIAAIAALCGLAIGYWAHGPCISRTVRHQAVNNAYQAGTADTLADLERQQDTETP